MGGGGVMRLLESTNEFNPESAPSVSFQKYETSYVQNEFVDFYRYLSNRDVKRPTMRTATRMSKEQ